MKGQRKAARPRKEMKARRTYGVVPVTVPVASFVPEPFEVLQPIPVVIQPADDGFTATFFDANIGTSGDTQEEALANLKSLLVDIFTDLRGESPEKLGPEPSRQLSVLKAFIKKIP